MDFATIEKSVRELHIQMWKERRALLGKESVRPEELLEPELAAAVLGVDFEYYEELGRFGSGLDRYEVAGLIDRDDNKIAVSLVFRGAQRRFTGAHEVGHWVLHPDQVLHRDRPIDGIRLDRTPRPPKEKEADYFAACFLVPARLAIEAMEFTFQVNGKFVLTHQTAFLLRPDDPEFLLTAGTDSWDLALAVATVKSYNGRHVKSLAEQFQVSPSTMAIRLQELKLLAA